MPMVTSSEPQPPRRVSAAPSLACDLSWLLMVAAQPSMQVRYPQLAEMFNGREDLADCVRGFWADGSEETCFTEMQILAHHAGATTETVPLDLAMPSEDPADAAVFIERFRRLKESPELRREYLELMQEVWAPVDA